MTTGLHIDGLQTPVTVIDEDIMDANIAAAQRVADDAGIAFRPHIKTHKLPFVAERQIRAGAIGINCQKLSEAQVFADAGFNDILITFNMLGDERLQHLGELNQRVTLSVTADNAQVVQELAGHFQPDRPLAVLVECETGAERCGVQTPRDALDLALLIAAAPGLRFRGLMTYPRGGGEARVEAFFAETMHLLAAAGIPCPVRTTGGTPGLFRAGDVPSATEYRAGTYVYNDRKILSGGSIGLDDCAMQVIATVVSRPTADRAILDSGSKALTSDLLGLDGHGLIRAYPQARIAGLSEEHGHIDLSACTGPRPVVGERLAIIPNHTCTVTNLADHLVFHRKGIVTRIDKAEARGKVW